VKFNNAPLALELSVFDLVTDIVALKEFVLSSALFIATISPVPIIEPTLTFDFAPLLEPPPLPPEAFDVEPPDDDSAAFATELVVPPFPPDLVSVGVVVGSVVLVLVSVPPPEPPEPPEPPVLFVFDPLFPVFPPPEPEFPVFDPEFPVFVPPEPPVFPVFVPDWVLLLPF
jgi:hypothetical protein